MRLYWTFLLCAIGGAVPAIATGQGPDQFPRAIALPDTMGANFSIADSATASGTREDFDFLIGVWHFTFQQRRPNGSFGPAFIGHWSAEKKRTANSFVEDHFRADSRRSPAGSGTWTFRVFNPQRKLWEMKGVDSERGVWAPGLCWSDATSRYVTQHYGTSIMRIRYFAINDTSFLWRADLSEDTGRTWIGDWWTMQAHRVAR